MDLEEMGEYIGRCKKDSLHSLSALQAYTTTKHDITNTAGPLRTKTFLPTSQSNDIHRKVQGI
jgi:hypothetical protein